MAGSSPRCLRTVAFLLLVAITHGSDPSYSECQPLIDATIRDLAAKALVSGQKPSAISHEKTAQVDDDNESHHIKTEHSDIKTEKYGNPNVEKHIKDQKRKFDDQQNKDDESLSDVKKQISSSHPIKTQNKQNLPVNSRNDALPPAKNSPPAPPNIDLSNYKNEKHKTHGKPSAKHSAPAPTKIDLSKSKNEKSNNQEKNAAEEAYYSGKRSKQELHDKIKKYHKKENTSLFNKLIAAIFGNVEYSERDKKWSKPWQTHCEHKKQPTKKHTKDAQADVSPNFIGKIINKFVDLVFEKVLEKERDLKWEKPWQTHTNFPKKNKENVVIDNSPGIFSQSVNKFVYFIFGKTPENAIRDKKWAKPWQEHIGKTAKQKSEVHIYKYSTGIFGSTINQLVQTIFGKVPYKRRDEKWSKPWQMHSEHSNKAPVHAKQEVKIVGPSGGVLHTTISLLFGNPDGPRHEKWAEPWQKHDENVRKYTSDSVKEPKSKEIKAYGGILDNVIRILFPGQLGKRDRKWAKPWQTHAEKSDSHRDDKKHTIVNIETGILGRFINKMVAVVFGSSPEMEKDPKWAKPWQTHKEHILSDTDVNNNTVVDIETGIVGKCINKMVAIVFGPTPELEKAPKWAKPWQTHKEHIHSDTDVKNNTVVDIETGTIGQLINKIVAVVFGPTPELEKDPKWAEPWQTHKEPYDDDDDIEVDMETGSLGSMINRLVAIIFGTTPNVERSEKWSIPWQQHKQEEEEESKPYQEEPSILGENLDRLIRSIFNLGRPDKRDKKWSRPWQSHEDDKASTQSERYSEKPDKTRKLSSKPDPTSKTDGKKSKGDLKAQADKQGKNKKDEDDTVDELYPQDRSNDDDDDNDNDEIEEANLIDDDEDYDSDDDDETDDKHDFDTEDDNSLDEMPIKKPSSRSRSRTHIDSILGLDDESINNMQRLEPIADSVLKKLKSIYENKVKPLEDTYSYDDITNRHLSEAELFSRPMVLLLGPYSTGKSTFLNFLMNIENTNTALPTRVTPSHGVFRIVQYGERNQHLDGTTITSQPAFRGLSQYGQTFVDQLQATTLNSPLLKKVTFVEAPGVVEGFTSHYDALQWFVDRADLLLLVFDHTKLDAGYELQAVLDQLKGREQQVRILLNKADSIPGSELVKVQGSLVWSIAPLLGDSNPPTVYVGSFTGRPYARHAPAQLFRDQEAALLKDIASAINSRVINRVAGLRRHAVRVRNHAQMVDTYLTTYLRHKGVFTSRNKLSEDIIENPHSYSLYDSLSQLTNISRYDIPDPETYRDFFRIHSLYDFQSLRASCSYTQGCPIDALDAALTQSLSDLLGTYRNLLARAVQPLRRNKPDKPTKEEKSSGEAPDKDTHAEEKESSEKEGTATLLKEEKISARNSNTNQKEKNSDSYTTAKKNSKGKGKKRTSG